MKDNTIREARQLAFDELYRVAQTDNNLAIDETFPETFANDLSRRETFKWLLESDYPEANVRATWKALIQERR